MMNVYKTKDFYFACVLLSNNFNLIRSERDGSNTVLFCFDMSNQEQLKNELLDEFVNQACVVNVKKFTWAIKILKNEIYGGKK